MPTLELVHLSEVQTEHYFTHCTPNFVSCALMKVLYKICFKAQFVVQTFVANAVVNFLSQVIFIFPLYQLY